MNEPLPIVRQDMLNQYLTTTDTGCEESPSCLECPLATCKYDTPGRDFTSKDELHDKIFDLRKKGMDPKVIALTYEMSMRQVYRVIQRGGAVQHERTSKMPNGAPLIALADLHTHNFKLNNGGRPGAMRQIGSAIYTRACRWPYCVGAVEVQFSVRSARCLSCGRDPRQVAM